MSGHFVSLNFRDQELDHNAGNFSVKKASIPHESSSSIFTHYFCTLLSGCLAIWWRKCPRPQAVPSSAGRPVPRLPRWRKASLWAWPRWSAASRGTTASTRLEAEKNETWSAPIRRWISQKISSSKKVRQSPAERRRWARRKDIWPLNLCRPRRPVKRAVLCPQKRPRQQVVLKR